MDLMIDKSRGSRRMKLYLKSSDLRCAVFNLNHQIYEVKNEKIALSSEFQIFEKKWILNPQIKAIFSLQSNTQGKMCFAIEA